MNQQNSANEYLKPAEAGQILRRSLRTLARMRQEGRGPKYHREGGLVVYRRADLNDWYSLFTVTPPRSVA